MKYSFGNRQVEIGGKYLTELKDCNDIIDHPKALQQRLQDDGYLLVRGLLDREGVLDARREMLSKLSETSGRLAPDRPLEEGIAGSKPGGGAFQGTLDHMPDLLKVANHPNLTRFFESLLGGEVLTFDYKWPRAMPPGRASGCHYDNVFMGRGTSNLYTVWTPVGDTPKELGTLALCLGSQHFEQVKEIYGSLDVDQENISGGVLTEDPIEIVDKFGGRWATTDFQAGDVLIFGMFVLHFALRNSTNRYRTSMDTRFQLKSEPIDPRFVGSRPTGTYTSRKEGKASGASMQSFRQKLGLSEYQ